MPWGGSYLPELLGNWKAIEPQCCEMPQTGRRSQPPLRTVMAGSFQAFGSLDSPAFLGWCLPMLVCTEMFSYRDRH